MNRKTRTPEQIITDALEAAPDDIYVWTAANLNRAETFRLAGMWLSREMDRRERERTRQVERSAATPARPKGVVAADEDATTADISLVPDPDPVVVAEIDNALANLEGALRAKIMSASASLRMEWTVELLEERLALPDGTITTWGEATVQQHRERAEMFTRNSVANAEGAARHLRAIADLEDSGAATLNEASGRRAAA